MKKLHKNILRLFEKRMLWTVFGPKGEEAREKIFHITKFIAVLKTFVQN
jgi:hypothetical protein